ncbi:hypothetical protein [Tellurirhabdus rosea]|uniref:hypothetical protein n=1 Tax=Tellurirhabdus rosea TaxID=2674997 RepID=UPI00224E8830|nr:hypothetical protein [Tellurirhabdus rosea]
MIRKATEFSREEILSQKENYEYQPKLTAKLQLKNGPFSQETINEIALWKVNRYALLEEELISQLNELVNLKPGQHRQAEGVLRKLLQKETKGVDLPMASTMLRFRNPEVFQIIDRRAYRVLMVNVDKYNLYTASSVDTKVKTYFEYLDELIRFCADKAIPFTEADMLLYQLDKKYNTEPIY